MYFMNGDLSRAYRRLKKKNGWEDTRKITSEMKAAMRKLSPVPEAMAEELADFYLQDPVTADALNKSEEILELLNGTWGAENSILESDDWDFLKEQVNAWAIDMDMDVVTNVMKAVVSNGGFTEK